MRAVAGRPVVTAARTGLTGRRVQTGVIGLVLLVCTAAATLALGLLVDSNAPFDHAFATQRGAHVTAVVNATRAASARLAATTRLPGVTAASGPFPQVTVGADITFTAPSAGPGAQGVFSTQLNLVGRASPGGPVDALTLTAGRWARQVGEVGEQPDPLVTGEAPARSRWPAPR